MTKTDVLVIGSGIAGLTYALKTAINYPELSIVILCKTSEEESNTKYAQGGIAAVLDLKKDSFESHISDTLKAGDGLCSPQTVEMVVKEGPELLKELMDWGAEFDRDSEGKLMRAMEGGHSKHRVFHHKDSTGNEIARALLAAVHAKENTVIHSGYFVLDLITDHHLFPQRNSTSKTTCYGAYYLNTFTGETDFIQSRVTMLASGGIGQIYQNTTNPAVATGDGIAMAYRAGARISNMEFIQFHPTAMYQPLAGTSFLISEAVRGFGALLRTKSGELFMHNYDERKELASRDIVARAIDSEMKKSGSDFVFLDCTHLDQVSFKQEFPSIYQRCMEEGFNPGKDMIPVVPVAHYLCGGIDTNLQGETSINHLLASGECTCTGLHGANRLASNSLLEALVFSNRAFLKTNELLKENHGEVNIPKWNVKGTKEAKERVLVSHNKKELKAIMTDYVGLLRNRERLARASKRLRLMYQETEDLYRRSHVSVELCELRNMIASAHLVVKHSLLRQENRGVFFIS